MNVLVLNCGSSSLKFQLLETDGADGADRHRTARSPAASIESIGGTAVAQVRARRGGEPKETAEILEHKIAVERASPC